MIRNRLTWLNTMVTEPYYLFHFLIFFSYLPIRISAASILSPQFSHHLLRREIQAFLAYSILAAVKMVRAETWEGFLADTLLFGKVFIFLLALIMDYHLALWYMSAFLGAANALTPLQLETTLTEGDTSKFWLVEFRALCSSTCVQNSRNFPELSITYSNKNLSFGIVNIGLFPNIAEKFGISLRGNVGLPTYILFENNVEVARFPAVDFEAKFSDPDITKKHLSQLFELDRLLIEYVNGK
uniref:Thioredoxin domain-containing protein n=1 Tax=Opuntia streptacantha TaxID=393608 RepID=A0A7C8YHG8_OPUST